MIVIDAAADWLQLNGPGIIVGLALVIIFLVVVMRHVEIQNNLPRK